VSFELIRKGKSLRKRKFFMILIWMVIPSFLFSFSPQEAKVNKRKIEREHERKEKKAAKEYNKAKKDHVKRQSKETQAMMKRSSKEAKKNTPMKAPGGKKCK
jgi:type VI protein secretion system component VasK